MTYGIHIKAPIFLGVFVPVGDKYPFQPLCGEPYLSCLGCEYRVASSFPNVPLYSSNSLQPRPFLFFLPQLY